MTDQEIEALSWALVGLVALVIAVGALSQHPEWFR
jgi:uncharacterized membrane protein